MLPEREHVARQVPQHRADIVTPEAIFPQRGAELVLLLPVYKQAQGILPTAGSAVHLQHLLAHQTLHMAMHSLTRYPKSLGCQRDDIAWMRLDVFQDKLPHHRTRWTHSHNHHLSFVNVTLLYCKFMEMVCQHIEREV